MRPGHGLPPGGGSGVSMGSRHLEEHDVTAHDDGPAGLRFRCLGTRGSIACPGPDTVRFGGNTPCVEVLAGGQRLIFDAGTGIRRLGQELAAAGEPVEATLFLTHFHWDHVLALPFFAPAYDAACDIHVVGPAQFCPDGEEIGVEALVEGLMGSSYFPIPMSAMAGVRTFGHLNEGTWEHGGVTVRAMRVKHPSFAVGYRIGFGDHSIAYVPDNELGSDAYGVSADWRARFVGFLSGVDVLIHDAMYTPEEYARYEGHGHSTFDAVLELAREAGVGDLRFFHHDPNRDDDALEELVARYRNEALVGGLTFDVDAEREGAWVQVS